MSIQMDPHSCNSTSEDLHVCSELSSVTDDCHFLNIVSCGLKSSKFPEFYNWKLYLTKKHHNIQ